MTGEKTKSLTVATTEPIESGKSLTAIKVVATEQSRNNNTAQEEMSHRGEIIKSASAEPKISAKQDNNESNPLVCVDYACEAISSVFRYLGGKEEKETDLAVWASQVRTTIKNPLIVATDFSDNKPSTEEEKTFKEKPAPVQTPVKKQLIIATDFRENKPSNEEQEKESEEKTTKGPTDATFVVQSPTALEDNAPIKLSDKDTKTLSKPKEKRTKKQSSTKKLKAMLGRLFKKSKKSKADDKTPKKQPSQTETTEVVQEKAQTKPMPKPEKVEDAPLTEPVFQDETAAEKTMTSHSELTKESQKTAETSTSRPSPQLESTEMKSKKVSFAALPEKVAPPSPTAVASKALFDLIDMVSLKLDDLNPQVNNTNLAAARMVPLPESDSDSDGDTDNDSSVAESIGEDSKTFDVVKDINEMWERKEELMSELKEMWKESDQDVVKIITEHISFDEDDDDEPLESDYVLAKQKYASFHPQPQMIIVA